MMFRSMRTVGTWAAVLAMAVVGVACDDDCIDDTDTEDTDTGDNGDEFVSALTLVEDRGILNCGVSGQAYGFSLEDAGNYEGFDVDFCRAVAAAALGDATAVTYVPLTSTERFTALQDGTIDVLIRNTTWTQWRDIGLMLDFGPTTYYDGQQFMGKSPAFAVDSLIADIADQSVCVINGTTTQQNLTEAVTAAGISITEVLVTDWTEAITKFKADDCDLVTTDGSALVGTKAVEEPVEETWVIFPGEPISKEPLGPVYRDADPDWGNVVNWTMFALIMADEFDITSANIDTTKDTNSQTAKLFGGTGEAQTAMGVDADAFYQAVKQVGNYGEIFDANLTPLGLQREGGPNAGYRDGGLLYAPPVGSAP
jgi:general L-amino acid transport system substrate-binding protein